MIQPDSIYYKQGTLLFRVLPIVATEQVFVLKGGTAINMFVRDLPRLSVDADLIFQPLLSRVESLQAISDALKRIAAAIENRIPGSTVRLHQLGSERYTIKLTVVHNGVQVTVEVAPVLRGTVFPSQVREPSPRIQTLFGFASMKVASVPDLYGGKICAALDRQHPRDLFDIKILYENEGITDDIRKAFIVYLSGHDRPISEILAPQFKDLKNIFNIEFQGMTNTAVTLEELLTTRERLISDINKDLTVNERQFLISLKTGEPQWRLLSIEGIDRLPAIQWKLLNIRKMSMKKHSHALAKLRDVLGI